MVNVFNRRRHFSTVKEPARFGPLIQAPVNQFAMLTDYVDPGERAVACPNQDVVYGLGAIGLDVSPVVYQVVDLRTDSFVQLGKMYNNTTPGFYMLVGPSWKGEVPKGITRFRSPTNTGLVGPRIFMDDTAEDRKAIQQVLRGVLMYPLAEYDGRMKTKDWAALPKVAAPPQGAQALAVLAAARNDPKLKQAMTEGAKEADEQLVRPLFQFRNFAQPLPHSWGTISNESAFGTDCYTAYRGGKGQYPGQLTERDQVLLPGS